MKARSLKTWTTLALLFAVTLLPGSALAEPGAESLLAERLLEMGSFRDAVAEMAGRSVPPGTASDLTVLMVKSEALAWDALTAELPGLLKARLSPERIRDLARLYGENPEQEWSRSGAEMTALAAELAKQKSSFRRVLAEQGCVVGLLARNLDRAQEKAGNPAGGKPTITPEVYVQVVRPVLEPLTKFCECVLRRGAEAMGEKLYAEDTAKEERNKLLLEFFQDGQCPSPFAAP